MFKKVALASAAALSALVAIPAAAEAQPYGRAHGYHNNSAHARAAHRDGYYGDRYNDNGYRGQSYGYQERGYRCRSGTTGTIVGGALGALLGREIGGRSDRTLGTVIGGAAGALGGRAVTRDRNCR